MTDGIKLTLHWLNHSRSQRIVWLLEELELEYTIKPYIRTKGPRAPQKLKDIHELGKAPVLEVAYANGITKYIAESGHIVSYVIRSFDKNNKVTPETEDDVEDVEYYTHFCEGTFQPVLTQLVVLRTAAGKAPWVARSIVNNYNEKIFEMYNYPETVQCLEFMEKKLGKQVEKVTGSSQDVFLVGNKLSAADFMLSFPAAEICLLGERVPAVEKAHYPHLVRWAHEISSRPAYKKALAKTEKWEVNSSL